MDEVWAAIEEHRAHQEKSGTLSERRDRRLEEELREIVLRRLEERAWSRLQGERFAALLADLRARRTDPYQAAEELADPL